MICNNGVCSEGECWLHKDKNQKICDEPGKKCFNKRCHIKCSEIHKSCPKVSVKSICEVICFSGPNSFSHLCYKFWSKKLKDSARFEKNNSFLRTFYKYILCLINTTTYYVDLRFPYLKIWETQPFSLTQAAKTPKYTRVQNVCPG